MNSAPAAAPIQKPRNPFPAWRLPSGIMKASDDQLEKAAEACEYWAWAFGGLVVFALLGEFVMAVCPPLPASFSGKHGAAVADALIALGVAGEILFARMGFTRQGELSRRSKKILADANDRLADVEFAGGFIQESLAEATDELAETKRRLGEAIERAAHAERETEKLRAATAWRTLSEEQHTALAIALRESGEPASVMLVVLVNDHESLQLAQRFSIPFRAAGWKVGYQFNAYTHGIMTGVLIPEQRENWLAEMIVVNRRVREAFISANIAFVNGWPQDPYMSTDSDFIPAPFAWVYVGPKPMPVL